MGTDHLIAERNTHLQVRLNWFDNLKFLHVHEIHYSLTITLGYDFDLIALLKFLHQLRCRPDFITVAEKEGDFFPKSDWDERIHEIQKIFPNKRISEGFRNVQS